LHTDLTDFTNLHGFFSLIKKSVLFRAISVIRVQNFCNFNLKILVQKAAVHFLGTMIIYES